MPIILAESERGRKLGGFAVVEVSLPQSAEFGLLLLSGIEDGVVAAVEGSV